MRKSASEKMTKKFKPVGAFVPAKLRTNEDAGTLEKIAAFYGHTNLRDLSAHGSAVTALCEDCGMRLRLHDGKFWYVQDEERFFQNGDSVNGLNVPPTCGYFFAPFVETYLALVGVATYAEQVGMGDKNEIFDTIAAPFILFRDKSASVLPVEHMILLSAETLDKVRKRGNFTMTPETARLLSWSAIAVSAGNFLKKKS